MFYMDPRTAAVYLRDRLDYERNSDYVITIQVNDDGMPKRRSSTAQLNVHVKDVNDNPPVCEDTFLALHFDERTPAGSVIANIKCSDADSGNNGRLSYTITQGDLTKFRLQGSNLVLDKAIDVDRESPTWRVSVLVQDRGEPRLSTLVDVSIFVEDVDDNAPVWAPPENGEYSVDLQEHAPVGHHVIKVSTSDLDTNVKDSVIMYYIDDYSRFFMIMSTTGDIYLRESIDKEHVSNFLLPISAVSTNQKDRIAAIVNISIVDLNDNKPTFLKDVFHFSVPENLVPNSQIANVTATDSDRGPNGEVVYRMIGQMSLWQIDDKTGIISLAGGLDYETQKINTLEIEASDRGHPTRSSTCTVIITVVPVNEFEPIFKDIGPVTIPEDAIIGQSVFQVEATDRDVGPDGEIVYSLQNYDDHFAVESRTGIVILIASLDRETLSQLNVTIVAKDMSGTASKSTSISVNVVVLDRNDNPPTCHPMYYAAKLSSPIHSGDLVVTLTCTDADSPINAKLSYLIISGNTYNDFTLSLDGSVIVARKPASADYHLQINVIDSGNPSLSAEVLVFVQSGGNVSFVNIPHTVRIFENVTIGSQIFQLQSLSVSQQIVYQIQNISSNGNLMGSEAPYFKIDKLSGKLFVWRPLDREIQDTFLVFIKAKEIVSSHEVEDVLYIDIQDVNDNTPLFTQSFYEVSVTENIARSSHILTVKANDLDINENGLVSYAITTGNDQNTFTIDSQGRIFTNIALDRENKDIFALIVTATDGGSIKHNTGTTTVLISITDADGYHPELLNMGSNQVLHLKEDTPLGAKIFAMNATDMDGNKQLRYSISNKSQQHFLIDSISGDIFLIRLLDREQQRSHDIVVSASSPQRTGTVTVTISVLDVNDNQPTFSSNLYKFDIEETSVIGTVVGVVTVNDVDDGQNGDVNLYINKGNSNNYFDLRKLNSNATEIFIRSMLSPSRMETEYFLQLVATDKSEIPRSATAFVLILVRPEHKQPMFPTDLEIIHIPENVHIGRPVYDADATLLGAREGIGRDIMYFIKHADVYVQDMFFIDRESGELTVTRRFETSKDGFTFMVEIEAQNIYDPELTSEMTLQFEIDDVNDNSPIFSNSIYTYIIPEDTPAGKIFATLSASDIDKDQNSYLEYRLVESEDSNDFSIDTFTGVLSLKNNVNYEISKSYHFDAIVYDHGSPSLTATTSIVVEILDVNDNSPVFSINDHIIYVRENNNIDKVIHHIKATDEDSGKNGEVSLKIINGDQNGTFLLESRTGELRLVHKLDRETRSEYKIVIEARDQGTPSQSSNTTLNIIVKDLNDNAPMFSQSHYMTSVDRNVSTETRLLTLSANDADEGMNAKYDFHIINGSQEIFQIDPNLGHVYVLSDLQGFENSATLTVLVRDRGYPRLSSTAVIFINIRPQRSATKEDFTFSISEFAVPNTLIGNIASSSTSKYVIVSGNFKNKLRINEIDGSIFVNEKLDREEYPHYFLQVRATLSSDPSLQKDVNVKVIIEDENDNSPVFEKEMFNISVLEHSPVGLTVATIIAKDVDVGFNANLTYEIVNNSKDAQYFWQITNNGSLVVTQTIIHERVDSFSLTVVAMDGGERPRSGVTQVLINVTDIIDDTSDHSATQQPAVINFEMPIYAYSGYEVGCLTPDMFYLSKTDTSIKFTMQKSEGRFDINENSGCITLKAFLEIKRDTNFLYWVAAKTDASEISNGRMALLRIDILVPHKHVVVLTHSVPLDVLEINRKNLIASLRRIFPRYEPKIWKLEAISSPHRRKLLVVGGSKAYVFVVRGNRTNSVGEIENTKQYILQDELLDRMTTPDGNVSPDLTSEDFDAYPVLSVKPYAEPERIGNLWINTDMGKAVLGVVLGFVVFGILLAVVLHDIKTNTNRKLGPKKASQTSLELNLPPIYYTNGPKYNNLRRSSSSADMLPLMNALKVLTNMSEKDRNKLIEHTMKVKKAEEECLYSRWKNNLNKTKTSPSINIANLNETRPQTGSAKTNREQFETKQSCIPINQIRNKTCKAKVNIRTHTQAPVNTPAQDNECLSSVELETIETGYKSVLESKVSPKVIVHNNNIHHHRPKAGNRRLIVGGTEYDGVSKFTLSGEKYLYNTRTGDKINVSDDVLTKAVQHRENVANGEFEKDKNGVGVNNCKPQPLASEKSHSRNGVALYCV
ncbi:protocadherin Fat 4-like isoform X2 [Dreissena polymorpha]|uniref:protocadherin Fat 4-like isoform X2 n=1 Tax=Dreissena polymorpha TaxID=45954 RepID=UPI0022652425|nr:protocadherin Fat 4-like isoform X2 [Dreissena polymorpha]